MITLTTVMQILEEGPRTYQEVADEMCMHIESAHRIVGLMRKHKLVRVASWNATRGRLAQEFGLGDKPDAKRPKPVYSQKATRTRQAQLHVLHVLAGTSSAAREAA